MSHFCQPTLWDNYCDYGWKEGTLEKYLNPFLEIFCKTSEMPPPAFTIFFTVVSEYLIYMRIMLFSVEISSVLLRNRTYLSLIESLNRMISNSIDVRLSKHQKFIRQDFTQWKLDKKPVFISLNPVPGKMVKFNFGLNQSLRKL